VTRLATINFTRRTVPRSREASIISTLHCKSFSFMYVLQWCMDLNCSERQLILKEQL